MGTGWRKRPETCAPASESCPSSLTHRNERGSVEPPTDWRRDEAPDGTKVLVFRNGGVTLSYFGLRPAPKSIRILDGIHTKENGKLHDEILFAPDFHYGADYAARRSSTRGFCR